MGLCVVVLVPDLPLLITVSLLIAQCKMHIQIQPEAGRRQAPSSDFDLRCLLVYAAFLCDLVIIFTYL